MNKSQILQSAQVPGTDVTIELVKTDARDFPFRLYRTQSAALRVKAIDAGFATEAWARQAARSTWAEVVRMRNEKVPAAQAPRIEKVAQLIAPTRYEPAAQAGLRFGGSDKQEGFLRSLLADLSTLSGQRTADDRFDEMVAKGQTATVGKTSDAITIVLATVKELRSAQRAAAAPAVTAPGVVEAEDLPLGYFAVEFNGLLGFYHLQTSKNPQYAGRVFVNRFHSDQEDRVWKTESDFVKAAVKADPAGTRARFAEESEHCWMCGRRLTDVEGARARGGIGPECAKKI